MSQHNNIILSHPKESDFPGQVCEFSEEFSDQDLNTVERNDMKVNDRGDS